MFPYSRLQKLEMPVGLDSSTAAVPDTKTTFKFLKIPQKF